MNDLEQQNAALRAELRKCNADREAVKDRFEQYRKESQSAVRAMENRATHAEAERDALLKAKQ